MVSIAMPFYNCERTLVMAVQSILDQTYEGFERLLCDDGSTDRSLELARSFNDPRIIVWSDSQRKRLAERLNECIDRARGIYFARMDADDISYPERIDKQVKFMEQNPDVDLVGTHILVYRYHGEPVGKMQAPTCHDQLV